MSNMGFAGVANFAMTTTASAVRVMGVAGTGSATEVVQGPSLGLNFLPITDAITVLDPRITFSRTSNATLTGSNGLIQYAPHNLLTYSEQFDNAVWAKAGSGTGVAPTVSANSATAPNGTTTADVVVFNKGAGSTSADYSLVQQPVTLSVAGTNTNSVWLRTQSGTATIALRHVGNVSEASDYVSVTVTTTWQRFTLTKTAITTSSGLQLLLRGGYGTSNSATLEVWGAQLEIGSTATTYNSTTVKNLLGYSQAFDNAAWTKSNSFVQTNLLTYSQEFDNAAWTKSNATVTANAVAAPDGTLTADKLVEDTANSTHRLITSATTTTAPYTLNVYLKAAGRQWAYLRIGRNGGTTPNAWFDLSNGTLGNAETGLTSAIENIGNGWYRCSITVDAGVAGANNIIVGASTANNTISYTGDGTSGIYLWGAQLVQGSVAGDYQVTTSAAAAVQYAGPFGYLGADKLVGTAGTGIVSRITQAAGTGLFTISFYAKAGEYNACSVANSPNAYVHFELSGAGRYSTLGNGWTAASITSLGNGWYRCSATSVNVNWVSAYIYVLNAFIANGATTPSFNPDGTSGIYIFGAQLSDSASLDPYVYNVGAAPSAAAYYGPRFDYDPVTLAPKGLLIEEQRTNLLTYSEQFDNAAWVKTSATVTANVTSAPEGNVTADKFIEAVGAGTHEVCQAATTTAAATYTYSVYAKAAERSVLQLLFGSTQTTPSSVYCNFDLSAGTVSDGTAGYGQIQALSNGWYRCSITVVAASTALTGYAHLSNSPTAARNINYSGDGTSGLYLWGAQLEAGSFATSYIPTVASQVTRAADNASMTGTNFSQWYNQNAGTFAFIGDTNAPSSASQFAFAANDGTTNNRINVYATGTSWGGLVATGGATQATITVSGFVQNAVFKSAIGAQLNSVQFALNGALGTEDTSATLPTVDRLTLGQITGALYLNGHVQRLAYYPRRLANSELQALTA